MRRLSCLALVAVALAVPSSAAADELIADEQRPTPISAHDGRVAWSSYDGATERFELMTQAAGVISRVPVAAKAQAFDVDLGDNGRGDTVAAYSRCSREFALPLGQAQRRPPEGCEVFMFNFATGQERKIDGASTRNASEYLPTVAGGRVAFARVYERAAEHEVNCPTSTCVLSPITSGRGGCPVARAVEPVDPARRRWISARSISRLRGADG